MTDIRDIIAMREQGDIYNYARMQAGLGTRPDRTLEKVPCPQCGAPPMQSCTVTSSGKRLGARVHQARIDAAELNQRQEAPHTPGAWPVARKGAWPTT